MSGSDDGHLYLWKTDNEKPFLILKADGNVVNCIALHPDRPLLAVSGIDDSIKIIEPGGGLGSEHLPGHSELLTAETAKETYKRATGRLVEMLALSEKNEENEDEFDETGSNALGRLLGGLSGQVQIPDELKQRLIVWDYDI
jgi:WD40 repeat protein